ncbi:MAG: hypothetical protein JNK58_00095 [Phycisphaerae bacterium]|nr:hypothetical protein [Phycisphaerae bacterium]
MSVYSAEAVFCGGVPASNDHRFDAVRGLQLRSVDADESWWPKGSGVYVRWTDPMTSTTKVGILTARHFIDTNGSAGQCVQTNLWYA